MQLQAIIFAFFTTTVLAATSLSCKAQGYKKCQGVCVDIQNDPNHCGGCNTPCAEIEFCLEKRADEHFSQDGQCMVNRGCVNRVSKQNGECFQVYCDTQFEIDQDNKLAEVTSPNIHDCIRRCTEIATCGYASWSASPSGEKNTCYLFTEAKQRPYQTNFSDSAKLITCPASEG